MAHENPAQLGQPQTLQYPAPVVYYAAPATAYQAVGTKNYGLHYERQVSTGLGATQIILGCISIAAGAMAIVYYAELGFIGIGIWAGAFYLAAGSVAIAAGLQPTNNLIKATLVCSAFDILLGFTQVTIAAIGVSSDRYWVEEAIAANALLIAVGLLEVIFGIWLVVISSNAVSKGSKAQLVNIPVAYAQHQPDTVLMQAPHADFHLQPQPHPQSQPPPSNYYIQSQYPSTSHPQQIIYVGVHQQAPLTTIKF